MRSKPGSTIKLLMAEAGISKGSGLARLEKAGNIAVEQVIKVAKQRMTKMYSYTLKNAVKETAGACMPMGILVEGMSPKMFCKKVEEGAYDNEINNEKTSVSEDKKKILQQQLVKAQAEVSGELDELKKKIAAKAQKEATRTGAAAAKPEAGAEKAEEAAPAEEKKEKEAKKL
ncbi:hypothetical protein COS83_00490 [archaeon CG07_land_8_20_14_0_80_38_8]|nr:MAG: hypothetical protein COS83_00490 [archaeon CG07_land_8_20_14_0_80_38_8]PIU89270.1 MAG: hypothetical protein COS64_01660 [archaeon CG06_land_8_20_14_3_00_37_11]